jgi:hypothetical protein
MMVVGLDGVIEENKIMELKWMFKFDMYLTYDGVLIMIRIGLNKLSNLNWFYYKYIMNLYIYIYINVEGLY